MCQKNFPLPTVGALSASNSMIASFTDTQATSLQESTLGCGGCALCCPCIWGYLPPPTGWWSRWATKQGGCAFCCLCVLTSSLVNSLNKIKLPETLSLLVSKVTKVAWIFKSPHSTVGIEQEILKLSTNEGGKHPFLDSRFHYGLKEHFKSFQFRKHRWRHWPKPTHHNIKWAICCPWFIGMDHCYADS